MTSLCIRVYGIVQGVGFRPFVSRLAHKLNVLGTVANKGSYVEIHAQGEALDDFIKKLKSESPERSQILEIDSEKEEFQDFKDFRIIESKKESGKIFVSPDIAVCKKCIEELYDPSDRRYLHPFINCTACGPRLTILKSMPYDRERTTMGEFPMCEKCADEYFSSSSRRFDAQPVCCNNCGPQVYIVGKDIKNSDAITYTRKAIMDGKIAAVKGIGGFHLCCDGTNTQAVKRLRSLKNRPAKPFAVMAKNLETARRECEISDCEAEILDGCQKPIILLQKKKDGKLCEEIAPENPNVGIMLPYAPLQMLLFDYPDGVEMTDCLVMTSGNVSGAPICRDDESAQKEIGTFCDVILSHNRKILLRADDSVMDMLEDKPYMIRRSRGYAPLPIQNSFSHKNDILAVGGELKNTFCIAKGNLLYLSPYVGDMADIRTVNALKESVKRMENLLEASPVEVRCDMHPKYNTTAFAEELGLPVKKIQHHFAHILSCMAENGCSEKVIGVSFDGTGYGTDGTIWGGEILLSDLTGFERLASVKPFYQIGGDLSAKEGWRIGASMLNSIFADKAEEYAQKLDICDKKTLKLFAAMKEKNINTVLSTSCGRIFDGASAILGIKKQSTFEGEASMVLEFAAEKYVRSNGLKEKSFDFSAVEMNEKIIMRTDSLIGYLCENAAEGKDTNELAYDFHLCLSQMIAQSCEEIRSRTNVNICALSGGVFQNKLLAKLCRSKLESAGFRVLMHSLVPPNDGGIALGQAAYKG